MNSDFNDLLKAKMTELCSHAVERQMPKTTTRPLSDDDKRKRNREAVRRYSATPKGKENNRKTCRTYYRNHPEKVKDYVKAYKARFYAKWGVNFNTWNYWQNKLNKGTVKPEEVPERFTGLVKQRKEKNKQ